MPKISTELSFQGLPSKIRQRLFFIYIDISISSLQTMEIDDNAEQWQLNYVCLCWSFRIFHENH